MALENSNMYMPVSPLGNSGGWGGDLSWIILFLIFGMFGGGGFGGYGGGYDFPWLLTGQQNINTNTNNGFRDALLNDSIISVRDGINSLSTQICSGFAGVEQGANARQIADMQTAFANQTAMSQGFNGVQSQLAQCCCDNRLATQDVKYTIATEACNTRAANTANTQALLDSNQKLMDKLCQLELDGYKRENDQLRSQLQFANMQASQVAQTAELKTAGAVTASNLVSELRSCPIPSQPVYGNQPIFTCGQNSGCGCNGNAFYN